MANVSPYYMFSYWQRQARLPKLTGGIIWILEHIYGTKISEEKLSKLRNLNLETVGREIAEMLDKRGYRLIPKFENHDLKHIVLGYEMTMKDEIRMQAFLVGNGNYTLPCFIFLSLGFFYPSIWQSLPKEYRQGKKTKSIYFLTLENCMYRNLKEVQEEYK